MGSVPGMKSFTKFIIGMLEVSLSSNLYLLIVPPAWVVTPLDQTVRLGESVYMKCDAVGNPKPSITWTHNGSPVIVNDRISTISKANEGAPTRFNMILTT